MRYIVGGRVSCVLESQMPDDPFENEPRDEPSETAGLASVVVIDRREDVAAICGRVDGSPTYAVVIHAPAGNRPLSTELGMRRLQRHAEDSGRVVAIATTNTALASRARQVGVPVARRPDHVRWDAAGKRVIRLFGRSMVAPSVGGYAVFVLAAFIALVFAGLALTMAPTATIVITPPTETIEKTITISASPDSGKVDLNALKVPATTVNSEQMITLALRTTGTVQVATASAKAVVSMTNTTPADVIVAAGALLVGPGAQTFEIDIETLVPAGKAVSQGATAVEPGPTGNVPPGTIKSWGDVRLAGLTVTNALAAAGGATEERPAAAAADLLAIRALARDLATSESIKRALITARPNDAIFLRTAETVVQAGDPNLGAGAPGEILLMDVKVTVSALAVLSSTLDEIARQALVSGEGAGEVLPGSVKAVETGARRADATDGSIRTDIRVTGQFVRGLTHADVRSAVAGRSREDAASTLSTRYGIDDAKVSVSPGWAPRVPRFGFRINVQFRAATASHADSESNTKNGVSATATATTGPRD
jgi:hypothetical protein